jgi:DNA-directed RNA polymerase subunit alpha
MNEESTDSSVNESTQPDAAVSALADLVTTPEVTPSEQYSTEDVEACFVSGDTSWVLFRQMQRVASSSDNNRKLFETLTHGLDASASDEVATRKGACYYILGRTKQTEATLALAHPAQPIASTLLGRLYEDAECYGQACEIYGTALANHPEDRGALLGLTKTLLLLGESEQAKLRLDEARVRFGTDVEVTFLDGFKEELEGEYEAARVLYEKVIEEDPDHARALFRLGRYHMTWGDEDEAVSFYERCCKQVPSHGNALINLGLLYEDRSNFELAIRCYQTVLKAIPDHSRATMFLKDAQASKSMFYDEDRERRQDRQNQVLNIPVTDFELSVRSRNCLNKMNIKTLGDLMKMSEAELLAHKNFGETSLLEVKQMLAQKGLRLGQARGQMGDFQATRAGTETVESQEDVLTQPVSNLELSVRSRNCMNRLGIKVVGDLTSRSEQELLSAKNFGETSLNEIKTRLAELGLGLRRGAAE